MYKGLGIHSINEETVSRKEKKPTYLLNLPPGAFLCMLMSTAKQLSLH